MAANNVRGSTDRKRAGTTGCQGGSRSSGRFKAAIGEKPGKIQFRGQPRTRPISLKAELAPSSNCGCGALGLGPCLQANRPARSRRWRSFFLDQFAQCLSGESIVVGLHSMLRVMRKGIVSRKVMPGKESIEVMANDIEQADETGNGAANRCRPATAPIAGKTSGTLSRANSRSSESGGRRRMPQRRGQAGNEWKWMPRIDRQRG